MSTTTSSTMSTTITDVISHKKSKTTTALTHYNYRVKITYDKIDSVRDRFRSSTVIMNFQTAANFKAYKANVSALKKIIHQHMPPTTRAFWEVIYIHFIGCTASTEYKRKIPFIGIESNPTSSTSSVSHQTHGFNETN